MAPPEQIVEINRLNMAMCTRIHWCLIYCEQSKDDMELWKAGVCNAHVICQNKMDIRGIEITNQLRVINS